MVEKDHGNRKSQNKIAIESLLRPIRKRMPDTYDTVEVKTIVESAVGKVDEVTAGDRHLLGVQLSKSMSSCNIVAREEARELGLTHR